MRVKKWAVPLLTGILAVLLAGLILQSRQLQTVQTQTADRIAAAETAAEALQMEVDRLTAEQTDLQEKYEEATAPAEPDNPIDGFYQPLLAHSATAALGYLYYEYGKAWQAELYARAEGIRAELVYQEDKDVLEAYLTAVENEADAVNGLAWLFEAQWDIPPDQTERYSYSGTGFRARIEEKTANVYRDAVFRDFYYYGPYVFDEAAARAELEAVGVILDD